MHKMERPLAGASFIVKEKCITFITFITKVIFIMFIMFIINIIFIMLHRKTQCRSR